jgi:hypothetical protein
MSKKTPGPRPTGEPQKLLSFKKLFLSARYKDLLEQARKHSPQLKTGDRVYLIAALAFMGQGAEAELELQAFKDHFNDDQKVVCRFFLAISLARRGDFAKSLPLFIENLLKSREPTATNTQKFYAYQGVGFYRHLQSRYKRSLHWSTLAYEVAYRHGGALGRILSGDLKAHSLQAVGEFGQAFALFSSVADLARECGNLNFANSIEISLLCTRARLGLLENPEPTLLKKQQDLGVQNTYSRTEILIELLRLKNLHFSSQEFDLLYSEAIQLAEKFGHRRHRVNLLCRKSYSHILRGEPEPALRILLAAEQDLDRKNDLSLYSEILGLRLRILAARDQQRKEQILMKLEEIARRTGGYSQNRHLSQLKGEKKPANLLDRTGLLIDQLPASGFDRPSLAVITQDRLWALLARPSASVWEPHLLSFDLVPEKLLILSKGRAFLSHHRLTPQLRKLLTCLMNEPCQREDLVNRIWGYDYDPLRHDPMVLTLIQRLREALGPYRQSLRVKEGIFEIFPRFEWLRTPLAEEALKKVEIKMEAAALAQSDLNFRQNQILAHLVLSKNVKVGEIMKQFSVSRMTAHRDLETLRKEGYLQRKGKGRGSEYYLI